MFRVAPVLRRISPFSLFLMDQKNNPSLAGLSLVKRSQLVTKMYKTLPQKKRANLERRAIKHPSFVSKPKKKVKTVSFKEYVALHKNKVRALPPSKQMNALSKMYNLKKAVVISGRKGKKTVVYPCKNLEQTIKAKLKRYESLSRRSSKVSEKRTPASGAGKGKVSVVSASSKLNARMKKVPLLTPMGKHTSKKGNSSIAAMKLTKNGKKGIALTPKTPFFLNYLKSSESVKKKPRSSSSGTSASKTSILPPTLAISPTRAIKKK